jgi:hypothetical protein
MNKRLAKRHKRQVSREKERVRLSEPDLRTPEQIKAAREASRPAAARGRNGALFNSAPSIRNGQTLGLGSSAKTDV